MSLDVFGELYSFGQGGLIPKLVLSVLVPAFVLPIYSSHIKTVTMAFEEEEDYSFLHHD